jgi:hypothetical protein
VVLALLAGVFFLRVLAQALAATVEPAFLPPLSEWVRPSASPFSTSGLVPYPLLLGTQVAILIVQGLACRDLARGRGYFACLSPGTGRLLVGLSYLYAAGMVARYVLTMLAHSERRWLGHTVPIAVHLVLAGFLFTLGRYQVVRGGAVAGGPGADGPGDRGRRRPRL